MFSRLLYRNRAVFYPFTQKSSLPAAGLAGDPAAAGDPGRESVSAMG